MTSFGQKIVASLKKNAVVAGTGAALVILSGVGFDLIPVFGHELPKVFVSAAALGLSGMAADQLIPVIRPYGHQLFGQNPAIDKFENLILYPAALSLTTLLLSSIASPAVLENEVQGVAVHTGVIQHLAVGASAAVLGSYVSQGMGWPSLA